MKSTSRVDISAPGDKDTDMKKNETNHRPCAARSLLMPGMLLASTLLLAACAATGPKGDDELVERAQARWDAIIERDYDTAYALYSPGYRSTATRTDFEIELRSRRISWTEAAYREHECDGSVCTVTFDVKYVAPRPAPGIDKWDGRSSVNDTWIQSSGQWWYVPPER